MTTERLEQAIARLKTLPTDQQDAIANLVGCLSGESTASPNWGISDRFLILLSDRAIAIRTNAIAESRNYD